MLQSSKTLISFGMNELEHIRCMWHWHHHLGMELLSNMMIFFQYLQIFWDCVCANISGSQKYWEILLHWKKGIYNYFEWVAMEFLWFLFLWKTSKTGIHVYQSTKRTCISIYLQMEFWRLLVQINKSWSFRYVQ